jgi:hypothetical protein
MPTLHSHTHCQAAQAHAKTQAWQRVCLSNRTTETTDKQTDEKEHRSDNSVYVAIAGEVVNRRSVLLRNFVLNGQESASNPLLHIHANRCVLFYCEIEISLAKSFNHMFLQPE